MNQKTWMLETLVLLVLSAVIFCLQVRFPAYAFIPKELLVTVGVASFTALGMIARKEIKSGGTLK